MRAGRCKWFGRTAVKRTRTARKGQNARPFEIRVTTPSLNFAKWLHICVILTLDGVKQFTCKMLSSCCLSATFDGLVNTTSGQHVASFLARRRVGQPQRLPLEVEVTASAA